MPRGVVWGRTMRSVTTILKICRDARPPLWRDTFVNLDLSFCSFSSWTKPLLTISHGEFVLPHFRKRIMALKMLFNHIYDLRVTYLNLVLSHTHPSRPSSQPDSWFSPIPAPPPSHDLAAGLLLRTISFYFSCRLWDFQPRWIRGRIMISPTDSGTSSPGTPSAVPPGGQREEEWERRGAKREEGGSSLNYTLTVPFSSLFPPYCYYERRDLPALFTNGPPSSTVPDTCLMFTNTCWKMNRINQVWALPKAEKDKVGLKYWAAQKAPLVFSIWWI